MISWRKEILKTNHNIRLTSAELSSLWGNYIGDSMSSCILRYFIEKVQDTEIEPVLKQALDMATNHINQIKTFFTNEEVPIPQGFTEQDVNLNAPRLFSDTFFLNYIKHMAKGGLGTYAQALPTIIREDIRYYFTNCITNTTELYNESTSLLLSKGIEIRPPYIPKPNQVEFVQNQHFLAGWLGEQRPLTGAEITNLYSNIQTNKLGEALVIGFSQTASSDSVMQYFIRGKEITKKHIEVFGTYLNKNDLPSPMTWNHEVLDSTEAPFSDKLMMYQAGIMSAVGIGNYGYAISATQRRDLGTDYLRLIGEVSKYAEDGANIMIENGWMEKPPSAIDRDKLAKKG
jgi:hypothetical protein